MKITLAGGSARGTYWSGLVVRLIGLTVMAGILLFLEWQPRLGGHIGLALIIIRIDNTLNPGAETLGGPFIPLRALYPCLYGPFYLPPGRS